MSHQPPALIGLGDGYLDQAIGFERTQCARQRRLVETHALGQRADRRRRRGDLRHQAELGKGKTRIGHTVFEKLGETSCQEPSVPAGAGSDGLPGIGAQRSGGS